MEPLLLLLVYSMAIIVVSLIGAALPLSRSWNSVQLHLLTALSAGVFIGTTFIILIPDAVEAMDPADALVLVMAGFVAILLVEMILRARHRGEGEGHSAQHKHELTSMAAFIGLGVHSALDGFALGVAVVDQEVGAVVFLAILAHKAIDLFSLSTAFCLAGLPRRRAIRVLVLFSLITPAAAAVAFPLLEMLQDLSVGIPLALAGGTFMYVGIYDLLPEAFHEEDSDYKAYALVILGIALMYLIGEVLGSAGI